MLNNGSEHEKVLGKKVIANIINELVKIKLAN
jgi:hypothetical protein